MEQGCWRGTPAIMTRSALSSRVVKFRRTGESTRSEDDTASGEHEVQIEGVHTGLEAVELDDGAAVPKEFANPTDGEEALLLGHWPGPGSGALRGQHCHPRQCSCQGRVLCRGSWEGTQHPGVNLNVWASVGWVMSQSAAVNITASHLVEGSSRTGGGADKDGEDDDVMVVVMKMGVTCR